jgi:hypothetical protein
MIFGKLIVTSFAGYITPSSRHASWNCVCDCGNKRIVRGTFLITGKITACSKCNFEFAKISGKLNRSILPSGEAALRELYCGYKRNAKRRGIEFNITIEQCKILFTQNCHYCGASPSSIQRGAHKNSGDFVYNGIDRIDNTIGYFPNNIVCCCKICNFAKNNMGHREFKEWVRRIYMHWGIE